MSLSHFFAPSVDGDEVELTRDETRHARNALRIREGEEITVSDGRGTVVRARVTGAEGALRATVLERSVTERPSPRVVVFPAVPKSGKLDLVVEKLTELGVDEVRPWFAERTVVRWDERTAAQKAERWRAIAFAASKQSRRAWLPGIFDPVPLNEMLQVTIVLHEEATELLRDVVPDGADAIGLVIGPEGGIAPEELKEFKKASLGPNVLRTETAAIVAAALVMHRIGRLG